MAPQQERSSADLVAPRVSTIPPIRITVCGFAELTGHCGAGSRHVLSILNPGAMPLGIDAFAVERRPALRFHDVIEDVTDIAAPSAEHIRRLLAFGRELITNERGATHLLAHCHAGFSRSPAALVLLLAHAQPTLVALAIFIHPGQ